MQKTPATQLPQDRKPNTSDVNTAFTQVETSRTRPFEEHLGFSNTPVATLTEARNTLRQIELETGVRPALIYVVFAPNKASQRDTTLQDSDQLELILVTANSSPIRKRVEGARRSQVLALALKFRAEVSDPIKTRTTSYLTSAKQLHEWIVAPLEADLKAQGVRNLVFVMDAGLRSMPIAAVHDGQGFLVEKYSVGLMPSLSLTDARYTNIKNVQVLGMGISKSTQNQPPLPAVMTELTTLVGNLWSGKLFFNENATIKNLKVTQRLQPFGIIHLATHADFKPGAIGNSYIQLWNDKLRMDQVRQLGWNDPQVEMLVLSACRTAIGDEQSELGFAGLAIQTGVKTTVASLWFVNDVATAAVMTKFYQSLKTAPTKSEALKQAQVAMIREQVYLENGQLQGVNSGKGLLIPSASLMVRDQKLSHPYYWAAFTMVGNPW